MKFDKKFMAIMIKYIKKEKCVLPSKKPKTVKYTELQIPKQP